MAPAVAWQGSQLQRGGDGREDVQECRTDEAPLEREATGCGTGGGPPI